MYMEDVIVEYPIEWSKLENENKNNQCPNVSGFYDVDAEIPKAQILSCYRLDFQLLSKKMPEFEDYYRTGHSKRWTWQSRCEVVLSGTVAELQQPNHDQLSIKMWERNSPKGTQTLSIKNGDFHCENGNLILKKRFNVDTIVLANHSSSETRKFSKSQNGWLIMESETKRISQNLLFADKWKVISWYRWKPVNQ